MPITRKLIEEYLEANDSPYAPLEMPDGMKGVFSKSLGSSSFEPISRSWADVFEEILARDGTPGAKRYLTSLRAVRTRHYKYKK